MKKKTPTEPRRLALIRMGKLGERVRIYSMFPLIPTSFQDYHELFPIPQSALNAIFDAVLEQNPGY